VDGALSFRVKSNEYFIPITGTINVEEEIAKLTTELNYTKGFLSLWNLNWQTKICSWCTRKVLANEKQKQADALAKSLR
jgi:valyl-tRNA synthetase